MALTLTQVQALFGVSSSGAASGSAASAIPALRRAGVPCDMGYRGNMKKRMQRANASGAAWAVILGDDELARGEAAVRNLGTGEQQGVPLDRLVETLTAL